MSSRRERRDVAELYFVSVVESMYPLGRSDQFHNGFSWGIHEAAVKLVGLSGFEMSQLEALAATWAEENCPIVDEERYEAASRVCSPCARCKEAAAELVLELVD